MAKVKKKLKASKAPRAKQKTVRRIPKPSKPVAKAKPAKPVTRSTNNNGGRRQSILKSRPPKDLSPELLRTRVRLVQMLTEVRDDIDHEVRGSSERDLAHINDTSDMATDAADGDLALRIAESEAVEAGEIERAIEKIDNGTYGSCEVCNRTIGVDRLQFLPFATLCIKCQELAEIRKREKEDELDDLSDAAEDSENA